MDLPFLAPLHMQTTFRGTHTRTPCECTTFSYGKLLLSAIGQHHPLERPLSKSGWCGKNFDGSIQCKDSPTTAFGGGTNRPTLRWEAQWLQTTELMDGLRGKSESFTVHNT